MTVWRGPAPLVLASQSSARQALLRNAGLAFDAMPAALDERALEAELDAKDPAALALALADAKAKAVGAAQPGRIVIGADQTLALGPRRFNKPDGRAAAQQQLAALAGHVHHLHSAVAVVQGGHTLFSAVETARMTMRPLSPEQIEAYLDAAGEAVQASVGAYQLEGLGVHLFARVEGDHFTILGLPLLPLFDFFRQQDWLAI